MSWEDIKIPTAQELRDSHVDKIKQCEIEYNDKHKQFEEQINNIKKKIMEMILERLNDCVNKITYYNYSQKHYVYIYEQEIFKLFGNYSEYYNDYKYKYKNDMYDTVEQYVMTPIMSKLKDLGYTYIHDNIFSCRAYKIYWD